MKHRPRQRGGDAQTDFLTACMSGNAEAVARLLSNPTVDPAMLDQDAIQRASERGHTEVVRLLLQDSRVDPSGTEQVVLRDACRLGHTDIVRLLLQDPRVDPSAKGQEAIRNACMYNHTGIVRLLLSDPRVDPSVREQAAFRSVLRSSESIKILRLLLQDPRVNPRITPEKARVLHTIPSGVLNTLRNRAVYSHQDPLQFCISVDHLLEKKLLQARGRTLTSLLRAERHGLGDLPNNLRTHVGFLESGKVGPSVQSQLHQLKGNYFGPMRHTRRRRYGMERA